MSITEVKARVDQLGSAWEQFKQINDRRLSEVEKKGASDPLTDNHLAKLNHEVSENKERVARMEAAFNRPAYGESHGYKFNNEMVTAHKNAFCNYLRKGVEGDLCHLETKALSVASDPDGGYLVSPQISDMIIKTVFETSPMRQICSIQTISSDSLEILEDRAEAAAGWTTESGATSDTTTPTMAKKSIPVHELYAQPKATQKLIDDSAIDIEAWLADKVSAIFSKKENTAFVSGDGVGKPRGILTYASGTSWGQIEQVASGSSGAATADKIIALYYALKEDYAVNATFLMNRSMVEAVRKLKDTTNQYLWNPGLALGAPDTLMGVPVHQAADMPVAAADSLSIACGDFRSAYQIVDRTGVRVLRDPFTDKPFVKFYSTKRVGGDVVNFEAIKLMKLGS
jgi:HK97 family phage major capsid protein